MNQSSRSPSLSEMFNAFALAIAAGIGIAVLSGGVAYFVSGFVLDGFQDEDGILPDAGDQLLRVDLWVGETKDALALLRPIAQEQPVWTLEDERLGRALIGGDSDVGFAVLWIFNYHATDELVFDRAATPLSVARADGRTLPTVDLPARLASNESITPELAVFLRAYDAFSVRVTVPPRSFRRVLVALRGAKDGGVIGSAARVSIASLDLEMKKRRVRRNRLENYLASPGERTMLLRGAL